MTDETLHQSEAEKGLEDFIIALKERFQSAYDDPYRPIPDHMQDGLTMYLLHGIHPGSFLEAVFCNQLAQAATQADDINQQSLLSYANFLEGTAPIDSWGDPLKFNNWINNAGIIGQAIKK